MKCYCWRNGGKKCRVCLTREKAAASTLTIAVGHVYEAAKPKPLGFEGLLNDRMVKWISSDGTRVQYDGPAVARGRRLPYVFTDDFKAWAGRDITDEMPEGEWRVKP